ncbi:MAG TPA: TetR/AcrR family transcriptional regulator [Actinomycetota bacterium]
MARTGGEERKRSLIAHAVRLFGSLGYDGTSLDVVAEAAGIRKQTLLYYFPTKDALFDACVAEVGIRAAQALEAALEGPEEGFGRAEAVIRTIFRLTEQWPEFPTFIREASRSGPAVVSRIASTLEPLRKRALVFLEKEMADGTFRRQDPTLLLFTLYTAVVGSVTEAGVLRAVGGGDKGRGTLKRREEELIEFLRVALTGKN